MGCGATNERDRTLKIYSHARATAHSHARRHMRNPLNSSHAPSASGRESQNLQNPCPPSSSMCRDGLQRWFICRSKISRERTVSILSREDWDLEITITSKRAEH